MKGIADGQLVAGTEHDQLWRHRLALVDAKPRSAVEHVGERLELRGDGRGKPPAVSRWARSVEPPGPVLWPVLTAP